VRRRFAFPSAPALRTTGSAAGVPALFAGFITTTAGPDFSCPCVTGYGSSPSRRGPDDISLVRSDTRPPRFRRVPFVRDGVFDHGRAMAPRMTMPHMLPSAELTASASAGLMLSRLNIPPHTIVVYASRPPSPADSRNTHYQAGATPYLGRTSTGSNTPASWRTSSRFDPTHCPLAPRWSCSRTCHGPSGGGRAKASVPSKSSQEGNTR
jgi:hypothetical protein